MLIFCVGFPALLPLNYKSEATVVFTQVFKNAFRNILKLFALFNLSVGVIVQVPDTINDELGRLVCEIRTLRVDTAYNVNKYAQQIESVPQRSKVDTYGRNYRNQHNIIQRI